MIDLEECIHCHLKLATPGGICTACVLWYQGESLPSNRDAYRCKRCFQHVTPGFFCLIAMRRRILLSRQCRSPATRIDSALIAADSSTTGLRSAQLVALSQGSRSLPYNSHLSNLLNG